MKLDNTSYLLAKANFDQTHDLKKAISTYLDTAGKACLSTAGKVCTPFDPSLVKPGDVVLINKAFKGHYIGMSRDGLVCVEDEHLEDGACLYAAESVSIPPKPKKTVKIWVYKRMSEGKPYYYSYDKTVVSPGFVLVADGVEVEVSE